MFALHRITVNPHFKKTNHYPELAKTCTCKMPEKADFCQMIHLPKIVFFI